MEIAEPGRPNPGQSQLSFFQRWTEPVRAAIVPAAAIALAAPFLAFTELVPAPPVVPNASIAPADYGVVFQAQFQYPSKTAFVAIAPFPETVTEPRWHQPWSEPVRAPLRDAWYQPDTKSLSPVVSFSYYQGLAEPVRTAPRAAWFQDSAWSTFTPSAAVPTVSPVPPVDYGVFPEFRVQYQAYTAPFAAALAEVITVSKWFAPWQDPVRALPRDVWFTPDTFGRAAPFPEEVSEDRWHQPWSEPVRSPLRTAWYQDRFQVEAAPFAEEVSEDRWHQPWSEPVRTAPRDAWFQDAASLAPNPAVSFSYYEPFSDPVRTALRDVWFQPDTRSLNPVVSFSYYQPLSEPVRVAPRDAWFQPDTLTRTQSDVTGIQYPPLSEPVRVAPRDAWFQPDTRSLSTVFPEEVSEDRWHQPWSEPVRVAPRDAWYQDAASFWPFPLPTTATPPDSWFAPFGDPVRTALRDAWYQPDTLGRAAPFPEEVSEDRWHQPWSEPVRVAPRDAWFQPDTLTRTQSDVTGIQYLALSEPVRTAPRTAWFQWLAYVESAPFPETVTEPRWHQPWSDPVRVAPRAAWYQDAAFNPQPFVSFSYFNWLTEPVRTPPRDTWFQPDTLTRTQSDVTGIQYPPLSEPVRTAPRDAWYQDAASLNPFPLPSAAAPADSWLPYFDDFARPAARVAWSQYQSYADGAVVPPNTAINILQSWEPYTDPVRLPFPVAVYVPWDAYIDAVDNAQPDTGKVWRRYWIQDDPTNILNRDAPHDLVWAEEDEIAILIGLL